MKQKYSEEFKQSVLKKLLSPYNKGISQLSREEGIPVTTLCGWRDQQEKRGHMSSPKKTSTNQFSAAQRLQMIIETASLTELELGEYCRTQGLYTEQLKEWKDELIQIISEKKANSSEEKKESKKDKARIKSLERELRRKDKALAETAALLVLRKKLQAFYGEGNEED